MSKAGKVKCMYCDGTGKHRDEKCIVCEGVGTIEVVNAEKACQWCKNRGYLMHGIPCTVCGGTGFSRPINKQRLF